MNASQIRYGIMSALIIALRVLSWSPYTNVIMRYLPALFLFMIVTSGSCVSTYTPSAPFIAFSTDTIVNPSLSTDSIVTVVDEEATFPGGDKGWQHHLIQKLRYPQRAQDNNIQGKVNLKYVIETDGTITNIQVIDGPMELRQEAVRIFEISPKWLPAKRDGRPVRSIKYKPIVFRLG